MVCKFKFIRYIHIKKKISALFNSDGPFKSKMSHFKKLSLFNFQALDPNFVLAPEPRVWELEGSSFGMRPYIYVIKGCYKGTLQKLAKSVILGVKAFLPPPPSRTKSLGARGLIFWNAALYLCHKGML